MEYQAEKHQIFYAGLWHVIPLVLPMHYSSSELAQQRVLVQQVFVPVLVVGCLFGCRSICAETGPTFVLAQQLVHSVGIDHAILLVADFHHGLVCCPSNHLGFPGNRLCFPSNHLCFPSNLQDPNCFYCLVFGIPFCP